MQPWMYITHLGLGPNHPRERHEFLDARPHLRREAALEVEVSGGDAAEDLINGGVWRHGGVEDAEVPLQSGWNIIPPST